MPLKVLRTPRDFADVCIDIAPRLASVATAVSGSKADAEDIVQQAVTIALEKDFTFESDEQFVAWFTAIVRNCALNHRRKIARRKTYATDPSELAPPASPNAERAILPTTGELAPDQNSFDDRVSTALQSMSEKARCCLLLRTVEELSYAEISRLLGIPEGTAMNLVHRSKRQLRLLLQPETELNSVSMEKKI